MPFFQNTAVVGGLLGENVQLNLKVGGLPCYAMQTAGACKDIDV